MHRRRRHLLPTNFTTTPTLVSFHPPPSLLPPLHPLEFLPSNWPQSPPLLVFLQTRWPSRPTHFFIQGYIFSPFPLFLFHSQLCCSCSNCLCCNQVRHFCLFLVCLFSQVEITLDDNELSQLFLLQLQIFVVFYILSYNI